MVIEVVVKVLAGSCVVTVEILVSVEVAVHRLAVVVAVLVEVRVIVGGFAGSCPY